MEIQKKKLLLFLKLDPKSFKTLPPNVRDVTDIGHFGTGHTEFTVNSEADLDEAKRWIKMAFDSAGES